MRGIGVFLVILDHMWPWGHQWPLAFNLQQTSWMLMDMFFVLSGFLITGILLDTRERPDYYKAYYTRRTLRIFPLYYAVLIAVVGLAALAHQPSYQRMLAQWGSPWWFFGYLGNIPSALTGLEPLAAGGALVPLWSLQVEEQFYLLFPILVRRVRLQSLMRILFGLCGLSLLIRLLIYALHPENVLAQYVLLPCRMEGLAFGACIAIRFRQGPWLVDKRRSSLLVGLWGVVAIGGAIMGGFEQTTAFNRTFGYLLSSIFSAYLVLWVIQFRETSATAFLRTPVLRYMGKVSYAAYLLHWPAATIVVLVAKTLALPAIANGLTGLISIYVLTFGLSGLSWHFFEQPLLTLKDRLFPQRRLEHLAA